MRVTCVIRFDGSITKHDNSSSLIQKMIDDSLEFLVDRYPSVYSEDGSFNSQFYRSLCVRK